MLRRARGRHLSIRWLCSRARKLHEELYPGTPFRASRGWRRRFGKRNGITRRKKTNTNSKSVAERLPAVRLWHTKLAGLVSQKRPGMPDQRFDPKYGRFVPYARLNVDQARAHTRAHTRARACARARRTNTRSAAIMFRFGDQVGWCVGRVKRFYPTLYGGKFNVEVKYEDGDTMDHFLSADSYVGAEIVGADLDNVVPPGSWVVIEKPK